MLLKEKTNKEIADALLYFLDNDKEKAKNELQKMIKSKAVSQKKANEILKFFENKKEGKNMKEQTAKTPEDLAKVLIDKYGENAAKELHKLISGGSISEEEAGPVFPKIFKILNDLDTDKDTKNVTLPKGEEKLDKALQQEQKKAERRKKAEERMFKENQKAFGHRTRTEALLEQFGNKNPY